MTNEEAIKWIERFELAFPLPIEDYIDAKEALDMAIKALEYREQIENLIDRKSFEITNPFNTYEYARVVRVADFYDLLEVNADDE